MSEDKKINNNNEEIKEQEMVENIQITDEELGFTSNEDLSNENKEESKKAKSKKSIIPIVTTIAVGALCLGVGYTMGKDTGRTLPATHKNYSNSKVVATVGETKITEGDLREKMEPMFYLNAKEKMTDDQIKASEASMIDYMTTTEVLYMEGKKEKVEATEEEVESQYTTLIGSITQTFGMTEEEFTKQFKVTKEEIKEELKKELIASKYMQQSSEVSDTEAKNYYDKNKDEFLKVRASHILIPNTDENGEALSTEKLEEAKKQAEDILKKAQNGTDFASLAKEYSQDGSAANGGDLDFFAKGQMVEPFEKEAFSLKVGEVSKNVVETQFGYHIIMKTDEKQEELDTVKEELKYKLASEKQNLVVNDLLEKYNVEIKDI
ncbi:MAG: peptidylprolyl isomerase [Peptostreptococcaceae bacterium]